MLFVDGSFYDGEWKRDKSNGKGRLISANGNYYEGDWVDNLS